MSESAAATLFFITKMRVPFKHNREVSALPEIQKSVLCSSMSLPWPEDGFGNPVDITPTYVRTATSIRYYIILRKTAMHTGALLVKVLLKHEGYYSRANGLIMPLKPSTHVREKIHYPRK